MLRVGGRRNQRTEGTKTKDEKRKEGGDGGSLEIHRLPDQAKTDTYGHDTHKKYIGYTSKKCKCRERAMQGSRCLFIIQVMMDSKEKPVVVIDV